MATTAKNLIDSAWARSTFNDANLATPAEMIGVLSNRLKHLYSFAAKINPAYFGAVAEDVAFDSGIGGWPRPDDAEMVIEIRYSSGNTPINIVPFNDREVALPPRVYEFGRVYRSVGASTDPLAQALDIYYSQQHPALNPLVSESDAQNTLDDSWPESFNDLLVLHLAKYLALKDQREGEATAHAAEETALMGIFEQFLRGENHGMVARFNTTA